jgi:DNA repair exonuclease SbcCD ATPase subunit
MRFIDLQLEKFRSFIKPARLRISGSGLVYLTGVNRAEPDLEGNGVGKSSIFEGLYWTLFGKTTRRLKAGSVANWKHPKGCKGRLSLEAFGKAYTVERTWGPNSLKLNGREVDQNTLETELRLSPEMFMHSILFPQVHECFLDLRPEAKMQLLVEVLNLEVWDRASEVANGKTQEFETEIARTEGAIQETRASLESMDTRSILERETNWKRKHQEEIHQLKLALARLPKGLKAADKKLEESERAIRKLYKEQSDAQAEARQAQGQLNDLKDLGRNSKCPTCGAKLDSRHARNESKHLKRRLQRANAQHKSIEKRIEEAEKAHKRLKEKANAERERSEIVKEFQRRRKETNPYTGERTRLQQKRTKTNLRLAILKGELNELRKSVETTRFWIKGFKEVRLLVVDSVIAQLEAEVNQTIHELGLAGWSVKFDVERETKSGGVARGFSVFVHSPSNAEPVPFEAWSGGETQRLRLAATMGFANLINNMTGQQPNLEMWDEPSNWVSARGVDQLLGSLAERARKYGRCIIVADHRSLGFPFAKRICVVKDSHGSHIEGQTLRLRGKG